jgi:hypothetical protein
MQSAEARPGPDNRYGDKCRVGLARVIVLVVVESPLDALDPEIDLCSLRGVIVRSYTPGEACMDLVGMRLQDSPQKIGLTRSHKKSIA